MAQILAGTLTEYRVFVTFWSVRKPAFGITLPANLLKLDATRPQTPEPRPRSRSGPSFITGINGFVGQYLTRHLVDEGERVCGIDLLSGLESTDYSVAECDILDFENLKRIAAEFRPDNVYHLAGLVHPKDSLARPRDYYLTNVQGTVNLLEALRQNEIDARVLIVSSSKVYGIVPPEVDLIDETRDPRPETPYAVSKYISEQIALQYFRNFGSRVVIARPFNHTGPGQPTGFVVPDFCKQIAEIETLPPEQQAKAGLRVGDLSPVRDFLDVRDVVRAYMSIVREGDTGECYNVCSGSGVSMAMILDGIVSNSELVVWPRVQVRAQGTGEFDRQIGDNSKLQNITGWEKRFSLEQTVRDTLLSSRADVRRQTSATGLPCQVNEHRT